VAGALLLIGKNNFSQSSHSQSSSNQKPSQKNPPLPPTLPPSGPNQPKPKPTPQQQPPRPNIPNNNSESKALANLIKADLQDALTNDSR